MEKHKQTILTIVLAAAILVSVLLFLCLKALESEDPTHSTQPSQPSASVPAPSVTNPATTPTESTLPPEPGKVVVYQCDPELAARWAALGKEYTGLTGIQVIVCATEEDGCSISRSEVLAQEDAPTIFCLHSQEDFAEFREYCFNFQGDPLLKELCRDIFTLSDGEGVWGVASNIESYGLIYNASLLARTGYTISDIKDYASLVNISQFITKNAKALGCSAFTSPDLASTSHGSLLCLLAGLHASNSDLRSFWDLYADNCLSGTDGIQEFLNSQAVFYLGGTWDYEVLSPLTELVANNLQMLPIYTSTDSENLGLFHSCTGYWCVNRNAREADIAASLDFLLWLVTAQGDAPAPVDSLQLLSPYKDATYYANPLEEIVREYLAEDLVSIDWNSCDTLTTDQLEALGNVLKAYAAKPNDDNWAKVEQLWP